MSRPRPLRGSYGGEIEMTKTENRISAFTSDFRLSCASDPRSYLQCSLLLGNWILFSAGVATCNHLRFCTSGHPERRGHDDGRPPRYQQQCASLFWSAGAGCALKVTAALTLLNIDATVLSSRGYFSLKAQKPTRRANPKTKKLKKTAESAEEENARNEPGREKTRQASQRAGGRRG